MAEELKREAAAANAADSAAEAKKGCSGASETEKARDAAAKTQADGSASEQQDKHTSEQSAEAEAKHSAEASESAEKAEAGAKAKPDAKDKQIDELTDKYKRLFAEFDNFRKRSETEKAGMFSEGERAVLGKILPVVDNFERAQQNVPEELKSSSYVEGMDKIYRSFLDVLKELGVTPIEAKGKPFDANLHNAVMHVEDEAQEENLVVEEFQKGYLFKDKVLRHSMVKVAN